MTTQKEVRLQKILILAIVNTYKEKHLPYLSDKFFCKALKIRKTAIGSLLKSMEDEGLIIRETCKLQKDFVSGRFFRLRVIHGQYLIDNQQEIFGILNENIPLKQKRYLIKKMLEKSSIVPLPVEDETEVCYDDICCREILK